tara:strand:+ start:767 stop:2230 length:1464 start_codon:yes stop_codon:yes gene_type:complete
MKLLKDILFGVRILDVLGSTLVAINNASSNSKNIKKDSLFIAIQGTSADGHEFIEESIDDGAIAIICEKIPKIINNNVTYIQVSSSSEANAIIAGNWYNKPSEKLTIVGITGTNGKTTTASLLFQLFKNSGVKSGLISTIKISIHNSNYPTKHTTPDPWEIQKYLYMMLEQGCKVVFMEVSSHGLVQNRVSGIKFNGAIFTNISHEHIDYHKTIDNYVAAKKILFDQLNQSAFALYNLDDVFGETMILECNAKKVSYGILGDADIKARILESHMNGTLISINQKECWLKLIGDFNVSNACAVYGTAIQLGMATDIALQGMSALESVDGRFQKIEGPNNIMGIVDYAHTPDALEKTLYSLQKFRKPLKRIITIIGCGGNRDKDKRPKMASVSANLSDYLILTSDNPRTEKPQSILKEMENGLGKSEKKYCITIEDRREAIKLACQNANPGDIILLAGKGHEKFQEINGEKTPFDDAKILKNMLIDVQT